ncbi:MAG: protein-methionine-sulfoxide reductase catalytic subunit MsrP [Burkholderiales bacterium]
MLIRKPSDIAPSEITTRDVYSRRREFIKSAVVLGAASGLGMRSLLSAAEQARGGARLAPLAKSPFSTGEKRTDYEAVTSYINFYEFGTGKKDPKERAHTLRTRPWTVQVDGAVNKPRSFDIEDLLKLAPLEERVYRLRCVEAWSMVIPWVGFPFSEIAKRVEPTGNAKYVEFITLHDPEQMPGQRVPVLDWPYIEGLRMDEAMHPLTLLTMGLYGEVLPNQNGAPVRIVVPWKYGFKSGKSLVRIRFVEEQPKTSWMLAGPREYGFYSNVNPKVDHPRWSQARERRIGEFLKRDTLMFNGYGEQVASLYAGMDLKKNF